MSDLAYIPFAVPDIGQQEMDEVMAVLQSGWLTTGPKTKEFESAFAAAVGCKHVVAVNSCTAALHLALEALGVGDGDDVVVPTMTFAATAEVVRYLRARPVLVDVRPDDHNVSVEAIESALTSKTRAIVPVHFGGIPANMAEILRLADANSLRVVADAAHAFPCCYQGLPIGNFGDVVCHSFYATKTITTGEGGTAATNDSAIAERMRLMSLHGMSRDAWNRYASEGSWYYEIIAAGYKYNMTDVAAALGVVQLRRSAEMLAKRQLVCNRYDEAFGANDAFDLIRCPSDRTNAHHLYVLKLNPDVLRLSRNEFISNLRDQQIGCSVHFIPLHLHPYYRDMYGYLPSSLPVATALYERSLSLPCHSRLSESDTCRIIDSVLQLAKSHRR